MNMGASCSKKCCKCCNCCTCEGCGGTSSKQYNKRGVKWLKKPDRFVLTSKEVMIVRDVWSVAYSSGQLKHMMERCFADDQDSSLESRFTLMAHFELSIPPGTKFFPQYIDIQKTEGLTEWAKHFKPDAGIIKICRRETEGVDRGELFQKDRRASRWKEACPEAAGNIKNTNKGHTRHFSDKSVIIAADRLANLGSATLVARSDKSGKSSAKQSRVQSRKASVSLKAVTVKLSKSISLGADDKKLKYVTKSTSEVENEKTSYDKSAAYLRTVKAGYESRQSVKNPVGSAVAPAFMEHLMMILDAVSYLILVLQDPRDFDECIEEMKKVHHPLDFVEKEHFQQFFDILDIAILDTIGVKLYRKKARKSMQRFFNIVYISLIYGDEHYNQPYERR